MAVTSGARLLEEPLLDVGKAAALLGVSRFTLYRFAELGRVPSRKVGRRLLFVRWELERWLEDQGAPRPRAPQRPARARGRSSRRPK